MDLRPPPSKRPRLAKDLSTQTSDPTEVRYKRPAFLSSFARPVSPPLRPSSRQSLSSVTPKSASPIVADVVSVPKQDEDLNSGKEDAGLSPLGSLSIASPFQLTRIRDLPEYCNVDTVTLFDLLDNVMIKEAWIFNFLFDVDWIMTHFDPDI